MVRNLGLIFLEKGLYQGTLPASLEKWYREDCVEMDLGGGIQRPCEAEGASEASGMNGSQLA